MIATKGGLDATGPGQWPSNAHPDHLQQVCEGNLRRLRLDTIPLYQLHRPDPKVAVRGLRRRARGAEGAGQDPPHRALERRTKPNSSVAQQLTPVVSIQNRYNLADRGSESLVDLCEQEQIAFLPWAPIQDAEQHAPLRETAARHRATTTQVVLAWLLARSPAMLPIPGTGSVAHLEENTAAAGIHLDAQEVAALSGG